MRPQQLMFVFGVFIIGTVLACIASGRWFLGGEVNIINALASFQTVSLQTSGGISTPAGLTTYWDAIKTALEWKYPFLDSPWALFVKAPLWIISLGVIWGLLQFAVSVLQGIVGAVRSLVT